jgi:hypothetical protein
MRYAIYPPIGIARLGNSPNEFFIGSERRGSYGTETRPDGTEVEVTEFKDGTFHVKRQAARFHIYEIPDDASPRRPATLPVGTSVSWSVRLVNKKDAVVRPSSPPDVPMKPQIQSGREDRVIDSDVQRISGANAAAVPLLGRYRNSDVALGELRTDALQRLLVLGGQGKSSSPQNAPLDTFYDNPDWHDDVGDGPVTAQVNIPGAPPVTADPAWVIVTPPDFAPGSQGVVTLHDVILQVAIDKHWITVSQRPSFSEHIRPILERTSRLQWVNNGAIWPQVSRDWARLADQSPVAKQLRRRNAKLVLATEDQLQDFSLRQWQHNYLDQWASGNFDPGPAPEPLPAAELTRAVLDGTVGQGFFPGIEAGVIVTDPGLYAQPFDFRFDHNHLAPGDLTALMALPWQADFLKCNSGWWPAQRPDIAPQADRSRPEWLRPSMDHHGLVENVMRLGVITPRVGAGGQEIFTESGRDPSLG